MFADRIGPRRGSERTGLGDSCSPSVLQSQEMGSPDGYKIPFVRVEQGYCICHPQKVGVGDFFP
jgi:hypothetical protein